MLNLVFATGNANKFYEASTVCKKFDILLEQRTINVDEIQHHDPIKITEAKVKAAFASVKRSVVVNDSSWSILALGGFPGGYMKDVTTWLSTADFQALMKEKKDKRIMLSEAVAYYDGAEVHIFTHERQGVFIDEPLGSSPPNFARLVRMNSDDKTISQIFDDGSWRVENVDEYKHWYDFAEWYSRSERARV